MAEVVRYVNTNSTGGDGTTNATTGATAAYATLSAWEAAEQTNLVTDGDTHVVYVNGTVADTTKCTVSGWTTGASNDITIRGHQSSGSGFNTGNTFSTSHYRIERSTSNGSILEIVEEYVNLIEFQVLVSISTSAATEGVRYAFGVGASNLLTVERMRFEMTGSSSGSCVLLTCRDFDSVMLVEACTFNGNESAGGTGLHYGLSVVWGTTVDIHNCTFVDFDRAIMVDNRTGSLNPTSTALGIHNVALLDNVDDFIDEASTPNHTLTMTYCAQEEGTDCTANQLTATLASDIESSTDFRPTASSNLENSGTATYRPSTDVKGGTYLGNDVGAMVSQYSPGVSGTIVSMGLLGVGS